MSKLNNLTPKRRQPKHWERFSRNVSIAGLLELYEAPNKLIRSMWIITLLTAGGSILFHTVQLIEEYFNQSSTFDIIQTSEMIIPFPNITACIPAGINKTKAKELLLIPRHVEKFLSQMKTDEREEFFELAIETLSFSMNLESLHIYGKEYHSIKEVVTKTLIEFDQGMSEFYKFTMPNCENSVSNCFFNEKSFDCCKQAQYELSESNVCFAIPMEAIDKNTGQQRSPRSPVSFTFDLTLDWTHVPFYTKDAIDGYSLHLTDPLNLFNSPVAVPSGMHVVVEMSRAMRRIDIRDCIDKNFPTTIFGYYDNNGMRCLAQGLETFLFNHVGCYAPVDSFMPNSSIACGATGLFFLKMVMSGELDAFDPGNTINTYVHDNMKKIYGGGQKCLPKCTRWKYEPRPSYSELVKSNEYGHPVGNVSRSRVTVTMGSTFYDERTEKKPKPFYTTFYNIGFAMSLYAGLSMISLAEILFYGIELCHTIRKRRHPLELDDEDLISSDGSDINDDKNISKGVKIGDQIVHCPFTSAPAILANDDNFESDTENECHIVVATIEHRKKVCSLPIEANENAVADTLSASDQNSYDQQQQQNEEMIDLPATNHNLRLPTPQYQWRPKRMSLAINHPSSGVTLTTVEID